VTPVLKTVQRSSSSAVEPLLESLQATSKVCLLQTTLNLRETQRTEIAAFFKLSPVQVMPLDPPFDSLFMSGLQQLCPSSI